MQSRSRQPADFEALIKMAPPQTPFLCRYRNWKGRTEFRAIAPNRFWYGSTNWHPESGLLLNGTDLHTGNERDFSVCDFDTSTLELFPSSPAELVQPQATTAIILERLRQISKEGWSSAHDDQYRDSELYAAAEIYHTIEEDADMPESWPWDPVWFKPRSPVENLTRAGALAMAERALLVRRREPTSKADRLLNLIAVDLSILMASEHPGIGIA